MAETILERPTSKNNVKWLLVIVADCEQRDRHSDLLVMQIAVSFCTSKESKLFNNKFILLNIARI